ncbi:MAG: DoxX family protein [Actinobacteria bacterium]|nr:DoxX family protein [Actinomycetota bacterium]
MRIARLLARFLLGGIFFAHGTQKLFGWFGGGGPEATGQMMERLGMHPGKRNAIAAGSAETFGGLGIALGACTPAAAAALIATMITAIRTVHIDKGFFSTEGGYEFNLALIAALLILVDAGPGSPSLDSARGRDDSGPALALAALAAGALGSTLAIAAGHRATPAPDPTPGPEPSATPASN